MQGLAREEGNSGKIILFFLKPEALRFPFFFFKVSVYLGMMGAHAFNPGQHPRDRDKPIPATSRSSLVYIASSRAGTYRDPVSKNTNKPTDQESVSILTEQGLEVMSF